jgi:hypothetical protein
LGWMPHSSAVADLEVVRNLLWGPRNVERGSVAAGLVGGERRCWNAMEWAQINWPLVNRERMGKTHSREEDGSMVEGTE